VESAFDDDLDTPSALRILRELERDESVAPGSKLESFLHVDQVLGLDLSIEIGRTPVLPRGAAELLESRARAREAKDWEAGDRLRDELAELGVRVSDTPETPWAGRSYAPAPPRRALTTADHFHGSRGRLRPVSRSLFPLITGR
jgi:cysteinyl-tRNA synthetase